MIDERVLYTEILRAIKKRGGERLQEEGKEEISFHPESLMSSLDPDVRKYEQTIRDTLRKMVQEKVLVQRGSPPEYCITDKFSQEYDEYCNKKM